jgi:hypothetical protein
LFKEDTMRKILFSIPWMSSFCALAHEGHGLTGAHGHATDALGLVVTVLVVAAMWWAGRK